MARVKRIISLVVLWIWLGALSVSAYAAGVEDKAKLFDKDDEKQLESIAKDISNELKIDVIIYTADGMNGESNVDDFAADVYMHEGYGYGEKHGAGVMLLIEMENRKVCVYEKKTEEGRYHYSDREADQMISNVTPYLSDGDYVGAANIFLSDIQSMFDEEDDSAAQNNHKDYTDQAGWYLKDGTFVSVKSVVVKLVICIIIGGIVVGIMYSGQSSSKLSSGKVYERENSYDLLERDDVFTHTTVEVIHHESSSSSSSSGGGGGSSHSSSGSF